MRLRQGIAILLAGAFFFTGAGLFAAHAEAAHPARQKPVNSARIADHMSEIYDVSRLTILKHHAGGMDFKNLNRAAYLANVSGRPLDEVISLKQTSGTWRDVAKSLNITQAQKKAANKKIFAGKIYVKFGVERPTTRAMLKHHALRDVAMAGAVAKYSGQSAETVLAMKNAQNKWQEVAAALGVNQKVFGKCVKEVKFLLPHHNKGKVKG